MMLDYINEAFKSLDLLTEEMFRADDEGINELSDFISSDVDNEEEISIIDMDAETEEDLQDSYVGKVVVDCNICHSHAFMNKEDIIIEDDGSVNIETDCPYCGESNGFVIIGEIHEFKPEAAEKEVVEAEESAEDPVEEVDDEAAEVEEVEEEEVLEESLDLDASIAARFTKSQLDNLTAEEIKILKSHDREAINKVIAKYNSKKKNGILNEESLNESLLTDYQKFVDRDDIDEADMMFEESIMPDIVDAAEKILTDRGYIDIEFDPDEFRDRVRASKDNVNYEAEFEIADQHEDFGSVLYNSNKYSDAVKKCANMYVEDIIANFRALTESLNESPRKYKPSTIRLLKMIGSPLADGMEESLEEDFKNVSIETEDQLMTMTSEDNGKVVVTTEPVIEAAEESEVIVPVSAETEDEIIAANSESVDEPAEEVVADEEELDFNFDEVDEESMNELGESYLKKVYENVDSFKLTSCSTTPSQLVLEGLITFKSGVTKNTGFIFEAKDATRDGKVRFIGENAHLCRGRKAFTLVGSMNENKLICESFTYNYRAKNADGKSTRVYGKVNRTK